MKHKISNWLAINNKNKMNNTPRLPYFIPKNILKLFIIQKILVVFTKSYLSLIVIMMYNF